jgi:hypothetical protein
MTAQQRDDAREREILDAVDACRKAMSEVLDRLSALLAGEEASFDPASAPGRAH